MKTKIIATIVIIVLIIVAAFFVTTKPQPQPTPSTVTTAVISSVVGEQYSSLIQEQLDNMSIDQPDFNNQIQDSMASDFSQFYYT